ncbi:MAG: winged helix-turn-helix domain-containing protein [Fibrobacter sp.]|uniref:winged helix-turn-helix domain-containing protein n=1 Tax=unclassified Fibrobacter TaxID=2634177 RepID=UPI00093227F7|nr:winged helix-turn-helix domain-containing protein [Fibrobacter sp. UWCM]MBQ9226013.1 winged helix-turn-helix domain-containing protein [Fibrobacter sp.]
MKILLLRIEKNYPIPPNPTQKTTQKILDAISNNPNVTRLELSEICGITADGVKWQLRNLTKSGRIARIGGDRGGHWEVHDK